MRRPTSAFSFALAACGLLIALGAALAVWSGVARIREPAQLDYGEGIILWQAHYLDDLKAAYRPLDRYPYLVFHYPPIYHYALRAAQSITRTPLAGGRWVSFLSGLVVCLSIGYLVWRSAPTGIPKAARAGTAAIAACLAVQVPGMIWTSLARVDMLALAFGFLGMAIFLRDPCSIPSQVSGFALFVLAVFTKQTQIAAPAAALVVLAFLSWKRSLLVLALTAAAGALVLGCLSYLTDGQFVRHLFLYNQNPFSLQRAGYLLRDDVLDLGPLPVLGATPVIVLLIAYLSRPARLRARWLVNKLRSQRHRRSVAGLGLVASFAFLLSLTAGKSGSNYNYFLEWNLLACALAGICLQYLWLPMRQSRTVPLGSVTIMACLGLLSIQFVGQALNQVQEWVGLTEAGRRRIEQRQNDYRRLVKLIGETPGPVVSENMLALLDAGKEIPFEPAIIRWLTMKGIWDESGLIRMTESARFGAFALNRHTDLFTDRMLAAIRDAYEPVESVGDQWIFYRPRKTSK